MNKWTHRRTHITDTYHPNSYPSSSISSSSDNLHVLKIKPGFHAELINNKNAAKWLESTMTTDLAKLHLYSLFLDIRRLQGHEVKFSQDICKKFIILLPKWMLHKNCMSKLLVMPCSMCVTDGNETACPPLCPQRSKQSFHALCTVKR